VWCGNARVGAESELQFVVAASETTIRFTSNVVFYAQLNLVAGRLGSVSMDFALRPCLMVDQIFLLKYFL